MFNRGKRFYIILGIVVFLIGGFLALAWNKGEGVEETGQAGSIKWLDRLRTGAVGLVYPTLVPEDPRATGNEPTPGAVDTTVYLGASGGLEAGATLALEGLPFYATFDSFVDGNPVFTLKGIDAKNCPQKTYRTIGQYTFSCAGTEYQIATEKR